MGKLPTQQQTNDPHVQRMLDDSVAKVDLHWTLPENWKLEKAGGMRMAAFSSMEDDPISCTIVSLGGMAGGLKANVIRWMRQVNITDVSDPKINQFLEEAPQLLSEGDLTIKMIDLLKLQGGDEGDTKSLMAGIIEGQDKTIFIKMTGSIAAIKRNSDKFKSLCLSLKYINE